MTWYFGYRFKWKHVRSLAKEQGFLAEKNVFETDVRVKDFLRRKSRVHIRFVSNYKDIIICFHESAVRGDLSGFKADMSKIMAVGRIFYGEEREPRWFPAYSNMGGEDDSSEDEELPSITPPGYYDLVDPVLLPQDIANYIELTEDELCEDSTDEECEDILGGKPVSKVAECPVMKKKDL